jgi:hypothetical protein
MREGASKPAKTSTTKTQCKKQKEETASPTEFRIIEVFRIVIL